MIKDLLCGDEIKGLPPLLPPPPPWKAHAASASHREATSLHLIKYNMKKPNKKKLQSHQTITGKINNNRVKTSHSWWGLWWDNCGEWWWWWWWVGVFFFSFSSRLKRLWYGHERPLAQLAQQRANLEGVWNERPVVGGSGGCIGWMVVVEVMVVLGGCGVGG